MVFPIRDKSARDTLQTLLAYVRDGAVDIVQEDGVTTDAFENGGFTLDPPARQDRQEVLPFDYYPRGAEDRSSLSEYNDAIDARIEREYRLQAPIFDVVKPFEMSLLLSVVRMVSRAANLQRQAMQKAASGFSDIADNASTPLGDAAPPEVANSDKEMSQFKQTAKAERSNRDSAG